MLWSRSVLYRIALRTRRTLFKSSLRLPISAERKLPISNLIKKKLALPGNRTRVARMGILHDTTTPAVLLAQSLEYKIIYSKNDKIDEFLIIVVRLRSPLASRPLSLSLAGSLYCHEVETSGSKTTSFSLGSAAPFVLLTSTGTNVRTFTSDKLREVAAPYRLSSVESRRSAIADEPRLYSPSVLFLFFFFYRSRNVSFKSVRTNDRKIMIPMLRSEQWKKEEGFGRRSILRYFQGYQ
ncbi:LOW QUALITY PROTEIN: hypothetical protein V1477_014392 [Vespula maculifrons]|uniref:Uncharacterized protein n=1 Tax=Vespula maculifrons TaxID=7453 RepID=A0ABD2BLH6_VESMC